MERCAIHKEALSRLRLRKVEDEEHLFLVFPNTLKVKEHFCSTLPLTHIGTFLELVKITNMIALAKFVACC
jgi:hypothetical protein